MPYNIYTPVLYKCALSRMAVMSDRIMLTALLSAAAPAVAAAPVEVEWLAMYLSSFFSMRARSMGLFTMVE